jgi:hypothetical protein
LAADQDVFQGQFRYAVCLIQAQNVQMNLAEAGHYLRLAAVCHRETSRDGEESFCEPGDANGFATGLPLTPLLTRALYERSSTAQASEVLNRLGKWLEFGDYAIKDLQLSAECYRAAATGGDSDAEANYGFALEHGLGVDRNASKAIEFYANSMNQQNPRGASHYALSLHFGCGCCEDMESALEHYAFSLDTDPSFATGDSTRCLRWRNKLPPPSAKTHRRRRRSFPRSNADRDMADLIVSFKVDPIGSMKGMVLGTGSFGRVTQESDPKSPAHQIAVKRLDHSDWNVFVREIGILIKLQHPCVVQILAWSRIAANSFEIWMELAANGPLSHHLGGGRRANLEVMKNPTRQACLICDLVLGMKYVHSRGIIHRDLKPGNILLDANWHGLISDFGLSRWRSAEGPASPDTGTAIYLAPEQRRTGSYTDKVDVFTFGLVAYEIIKGAPAFTRNRSSRLPTLPPSFGPLMQNVIRRCWSETADQRPSFEDIFNEFKAEGWAILPGADAKRIAASVLEVTRRENA